jgi:HlyD family secretion protein
MKTVLWLVSALVLAGGGFAGWQWIRRDAASDAPPLRSVAVARGDLVATISATGTVEPEEVIDVGAQVAGAINSFGHDEAGRLIDYGSEVAEGMVLAQIDASLYAADVAQSNAQLEQAKAGVVRSEADLGQFKAKLEQARRDWERAEKLGPSDALAQVDYDAYRSNFEVAGANVAVGDAAVVQARGAVAQAQASLDRAQRNLGYCTIKAPVKGVIIDRRVNIGQTVVASLNAPSLFLIAKDLKRMQVWVSVNEADIGSIKSGQPVSFTVDAYPNRTFRGQVNKVRLNAAMTSNVVTYTVEVTTDNSSGRLLPYLTANARFEISHDENVLLVPNAALRWTPASDRVAPDARAALDAARTKPAHDRRASDDPPKDPERRANLWIADGAFVRPLPVRVGPTDGASTEVSGEGLSEGTQVVVGELRTDADRPAAAGANPFTPQFNRGNANPGGTSGTQKQ